MDPTLLLLLFCFDHVEMSESVKEYSWDEIKQHDKSNSNVWLVLGGRVYDVTKFLGGHPGGDAVLFENAGKDFSCLYIFPLILYSTTQGRMPQSCSKTLDIRLKLLSK